MKLLLILVVLLGAAAWIFGRGRGRKSPPPADPAPKKAPPAVEAAEMLACAHCGVHGPASDAAFDVAGRPYCSAEHRVAGPR